MLPRPTSCTEAPNPSPNTCARTHPLAPSHLDQGDGAADLRLGRDVADHEAVAAAAEASVGDERALLAQAGAHDGGGGREHLGHAGAALGALVADHHHLAGREVAWVGVCAVRQAKYQGQVCSVPRVIYSQDSAGQIPPRPRIATLLPSPSCLLCST